MATVKITDGIIHSTGAFCLSGGTGGNHMIAHNDYICATNLCTTCLNISDSMVIQGDLTVHGTCSILNTTVCTTSAMSICNQGTGPALTVTQCGSQPIALFVDQECGNALCIGDIGTATFGQRVDIHNSNASYGSRLSVGRNSNESIYFEVSDSHNYIRAKQDESGIDHGFYLDRQFTTSTCRDDFHISRCGSPQVTVNISGNVGIGSTLPSTPLDIYSDATDAQLRIGSPGVWAGINFRDCQGNGNVFFKGLTCTWAFGGGGSSVTGKRIHVDGGATIGSNYDACTMPTNGLLVEGCVGIGLTNPNTNLHVAGPTRSCCFMANNGSDYDKFNVYGSGCYSIGMVSAITYGALNDWAMTFRMNNDADRGFWWGDDAHSKAQGAMSLTTGGIASIACSLKIGGSVSDTSSPSSTLHVYNSIPGSTVCTQLTLETYNPDFVGACGGNGILFKNQDSNNSTNEGCILAITRNDTCFGDNDEANTSFVFRMTNGGTAQDNVIFTGDGRVGIGTTNPSSALTVAGDARLGDGNKIYLYTSNSVNYLAYNKWQVQTSTALAINNDGTGGFQIQDSGSPVLFVGTDATYGGRVGINTVTPSAMFSVCNGEIALGSSSSYTSHFNYQDTGTHYISMANSGCTYFRDSSGNTRMTIQGSGNVGIGTISPIHALHVQSGSVFIGEAAYCSSPCCNSNGKLLNFDNSYDNTQTHAANKIRMHAATTWLGGFGICSGTVTYHSGGCHRWFTQSCPTSYGNVAMTLDNSCNLTVGRCISFCGSTIKTGTGGPGRQVCLISCCSGSTGLEMYDSAGNFRWSMYGTGNAFGFLTSQWGAWGLQYNCTDQKLYLNNNSTYYLAPNSTSYLNHLTVAGNTCIDSSISIRDSDCGIYFNRYNTSASSDYSNYIKAGCYPSQGYPAGSNYWLEYGTKGGHHFVVNTDGGAGSGEVAMDDFTIWQGCVDGDRLFSVSNVGNTCIEGSLCIDSAATSGGNIKFTGAANPYICASSYIIMPGGLYVSGGTAYFSNRTMHRGGICRDNGAYLQIDGGTCGDTYFPNQVGIGTTDPGSCKLQVQGESKIVGKLHVTSSINLCNTNLCNANHITINDPGVGEGLSWNSTTGGWMIDVSPLNRSNADGNLNFYNSSSNNIALWRPQLWVYDASNYATGTANSDGSLTITSTNTGDTIFSVDGSNGTLFSVVDDLSDSLMSVNDAAGLPVLEVFADSSVCAGRYSCSDFYIACDGAVGIGTTDASTVNAPNNGGNGGVTKLHVVGAPRTTAFSASDGTTWHDVVVRNPTNSSANLSVGLAFELNADYHENAGTGIAAIKSAAGDYGAHLAFITRPSSAVAQERLRITCDGNVGIGTTDPGSCRLVAAGDIKACDGWLRTTGQRGWYSDTYFGGIYQTDVDYMRFYNSKSLNMCNANIHYINETHFYQGARFCGTSVSGIALCGTGTAYLEMKPAGVTNGHFYAENNGNIGILDAGGSWAIKHRNDSDTLFYDTGGTQRACIGQTQSSFNTSLLISSDWSSGTEPEQLTIQGSYPSLALRNTLCSGSTFLLHSESTGHLNFYSTVAGCGVSSDNWTKRACISTAGCVWSQNGYYVNNSGLIRQVTGSYGSIEVDGGGTNGWEGFSIGGRAVFMHNNGTSTGIYNDVDNEWLFCASHNGTAALYHNGTGRIYTTGSGACINQGTSNPGLQITGSGAEKINMSGATDPYIRFEEGTTDKAYIQWNGTQGVFKIWNQEDNRGIVINTDLCFYNGNGCCTVYHTGNSTIPTNNNQLTNGAGYTTCTGTTTPSNTQTFTNKSGNISQWTNDSGYTTCIGDITGVTAGTGLTGGGTSGGVTLSLPCCITAGTYGSTSDGTKIDNITVDAQGRVTSITTGATGSTSCTGDITAVTAGTCMTGGGTSGSVTISHADTSSQSSCSPGNPNRCFMKSVCVDGYGHVTQMTQDYIGFFAYLNRLYTDFGSSTQLYVTIGAGTGISVSTPNSGQITITNSCLSDYRMKTCVESYVDAYDIVKGVEAYKYVLIDDEEQKEETGLIAHELQEVLPNAVIGEKDAVDKKGDPVYQEVVYSGLVPTLWSALRKSIDKIEQLEETNNTLIDRITKLEQAIGI